MGKYPFSARAAYCTGAACPLDSMNLSRPFISGFLGSIFISLKYRAVTMSAADREPPGCPDPALCTSFITSVLILDAIFSYFFKSIDFLRFVRFIFRRDAPSVSRRAYARDGTSLIDYYYFNGFPSSWQFPNLHLALFLRPAAEFHSARRSSPSTVVYL